MTHYLFVYGTLKRGKGNHILIKDAKFIGNGETVDKKFRLFSNVIPYVVEDENGYTIKGELFEVDDDMLSAVDVLEGYPYFYERKLVKVKCEDGNVYDAWMYLYKGKVKSGKELRDGIWE